MPTKKNDLRKAVADYTIHVPLGAGQLLLEKGKELTVKVGSLSQGPRTRVRRTYADLAKRGEKVAQDLRHSALGRRLGQTRAASEPVKAKTSATSSSTRKAG